MILFDRVGVEAQKIIYISNKSMGDLDMSTIIFNKNSDI